MEIKRKIRKLTLGAMVGLASLIPIKQTTANVSGDLKYVQSINEPTSYVEAGFSYQIPKQIKGFTCVDFYKNGSGYFGKTSLEKSLAEQICAKVQLVHGNEPVNSAGFGLSAVVPKLPKEAFAKVSLMPLWLDNNGERVENKAIAGYFGSLDLPKGFKVSSFGEWNVGAENGPTWAYGEVDLGRKIGPLDLSYNPALVGNGDATPSLENRMAVKLNF